MRTPRYPRALRATALTLLTLAVLVTVMMIALGVGMRRNDAAIDAHLERATATVLTVSALRTGVEFVTNDGVTVRPPDGVLYPGLLAPGQQFVVEYSATDPDLVRVAGRTASVGNIMIGIVLVVTWVIAIPLVFGLRHRSGRRLFAGMRAADDPGAPIPGDGPDPTDPADRTDVVRLNPGSDTAVASSGPSEAD